MDPSHVMSFHGAGGIVESITLCGVEPGHVNRVLVCKGHLELVDEPSLPTVQGPPIAAGLILANRAAMNGRSGMRIEFKDRGVSTSGAPLILSAWLAHSRPEGAKLQVVVTYRTLR